MHCIQLFYLGQPQTQIVVDLFRLLLVLLVLFVLYVFVADELK